MAEELESANKQHSEVAY